MDNVKVHARKDKIDLEIRTDKCGKFTLNPDDAMELGIKLLRAAYVTKFRKTDTT